jgi:hypothetical protein
MISYTKPDGKWGQVNLAEASYWMLRKREPYRPPRIHNPSSKFGQARDTSDQAVQVSG